MNLYRTEKRKAISLLKIDGVIGTIDVNYDTVLAKPQAKQLFANTDGDLRPCKDYGASGKQYYNLFDLILWLLLISINCYCSSAFLV